MYFQGLNVKKSKKKCRFYSRIAIAYDVPEGFYWLGLAKKSFRKSFALFKEASDQNLSAGHYRYGLYLYHGFGTTQDEKKGVKYMKMAFMNGDSYWARYGLEFGEYDLFCHKINFSFSNEEFKILQEKANQNQKTDCSIFYP
jgi:TPR repeat protein